MTGDDALRAAPADLRVDGRTPAISGRHVLTAVHALPRLSWTVPLVRDGQRQRQFEVRTSWGAPLRGTDDPWVFATTPVPPHSRASWSVRVLDENDAWSDWAAPCEFETGPFRFADWHAHWVSVAALSTAHRQFHVPSGVASARLHLTAQGLVRADLNGTAVNPDSSDPSRTDFTRALQRSYDVSDLVAEGSNDLGLTVAPGEWERTGLDPRVLAELVIELDDGSRIVTGTGTGMTATTSPVVVSTPFYLERHDATAPVVAERAPVVLEAVEHPRVPSEPPTEVRPDPSPPIRVVGSWPAEPVGGSSSVFGLSTNIAGRSRITLRTAVPRGTVITVIHGEHLDGAGRVDTTNLSLPTDRGRPRQVVEYLATGEAGQVLEPWFSYHGFVYLDVSGLAPETIVEVVAQGLHSDLDPISILSTDEPLVAQLISSARRTLLNNVHGIPEDSPTREQSGWTGDTAAVTDFEFASIDMQGFFEKWLGDLRTSQQPDGSIPAIVPDLRPEPVPTDPVWGAVVQRVLLGHWLQYGDARVLRDNLPLLRRWVDFQLAQFDDEGLIGNSPISYGHDWLALAQTPPRLMQTAATIESLETLIRLDGATGDRVARLAALREAGIHRFVDPDGLTVGNGSQGSLATAAAVGWIDPGCAAGQIENDIRRRGDRLSSGFATTRAVVEVLAQTGRSQVLMDALHQPAAPGIGAMLTSGPGTMWENWWIDPENFGTGSLDHIGLGGPLAGWAERQLAGIAPSAAGFSRFEFRPRFVRDVTVLDYELHTVRGIVVASYRREGSRVALTLQVPVGAKADVILPGVPAVTVGSGRHRFEAHWMPAPALPVADVGAWHPPARMPESPDVRGGQSLLADAIAEGRVRATRFEVRHEGLHCMPVPHAQLPGPTLHVVGDPVVRLQLARAIDVTEVSFVYAEVDTCDSGPAEPLSMRLELFAADGSSHHAIGRVWPAGWNRLALDLGEWAERSSIVAVEVSVDFAPGTTPPSFHLGSVGTSPRRRTW